MRVNVNIEARFVQKLLQWKSSKYYVLPVGVCSLCYTARKAHAPHFRLWPVQLYHIFLHYLTDGEIFGEMLFNLNCVLVFPTSSVRNVARSEKN